MTYTLVADGSSDKVLIPILTWSLKRFTGESVVDQWADFSRIPRQLGTENKLKAVLDLYPCELLFIHRDAEGQPSEWRRNEIEGWLKNFSILHVPVVPIRMTEAWLLVDESSIRCAAGNPHGTEDLDLPQISKLESILNPKKVLHDALLRASGRSGRRRSNFPVQQRVHLIPNYIDDYSVLQELPAFQTLQQDIRSVLER